MTPRSEHTSLLESFSAIDDKISRAKKIRVAVVGLLVLSSIVGVINFLVGNRILAWSSWIAIVVESIVLRRGNRNLREAQANLKEARNMWTRREEL